MSVITPTGRKALLAVAAYERLPHTTHPVTVMHVHPAARDRLIGSGLLRTLPDRRLQLTADGWIVVRGIEADDTT